MFITKVSAQNLGAIQEFNEEFGKLNLIYSHNEQGKTLLVEFIIKCLFKNRGKWSSGFRDVEANGKVWVEGLENGNMTEFTISAESKLENFLTDSTPHLPTDITKLLIVKGSETAIAKESEGGMSKRILNYFLSQKEFLNEIDGNIKTTIQDASIEKGVITGDRRAEIKQLELLDEKLDRIDNYIDKVSKEYSEGTKVSLEKKKKKLEEEESELLNAKRHEAYKLKAKSEELQRKKDSIPEAKINSLSEEIASYKTEKEAFENKVKKYETNSSNSQNYTWLKNAKAIYEKYITEDIPNIDFKWLVGAVIIIAMAGLFVAIDNILFALISLFLLLSLVVFGFLQSKKILQGKPKTDELSRIKKEFENRFDQELTSLADLETKLGEEESSYNQAELLKDDIEQEEIELQEKETKVKSEFENLTGEELDPDEWSEKISELRKELKKLNEEQSKIDKEYAKLNVDESNLLKEDVGIEFSEVDLEKVRNKIDEIEDQIASFKESLTNLKSELSNELDESIDKEWSQLIDSLHNRRDELISEIKELKAEVIGKIFVHQVIEKLRQEEDKRIEEALSSQEVQQPIHEVTNRYNSIKLKGEELVVSDEFNDFKLNQLSTGAKEQVMLALRIGLSTKLFKESKPFLILDDAFQNSDYPHREIMVSKMVDLAKEGYQIFYLTMDDHLRDLFNEKGEKLGNCYKSISLIP